MKIREEDLVSINKRQMQRVVTWIKKKGIISQSEIEKKVKEMGFFYE